MLKSTCYEITAPNGKKSYILGTLHLSNIELASLPPGIKSALENCSCGVFEVNPLEPTGRIELPVRLGAGLNSYLTDEQIAKAITYLKNLPDFKLLSDKSLYALIREWPPLLVMNQINRYFTEEFVGDQNNNPLDHKLMEFLKEKNKPLYYLETIASQLKASITEIGNYESQLKIFNFHCQLGLLNKEMQLEMRQKMLVAYKKPDLDEFWRIAIPQSMPVEVENYYQCIMQHREKAMAQNLKTHLDRGNAFIAVGCLHLIGLEKAFAAMKGYTMLAVDPNQVTREADSDLKQSAIGDEIPPRTFSFSPR